MNTETPAEDTLYPSFCMLELFISDIEVDYAFMYNGKRFYVAIRTEQLRGEGTLLDDFKNFKHDMDDPEIMFRFEEWILDSLEDFMQQAAPTPRPGNQKSITVLDYFSPETFAFDLTNEQRPWIHGDSSPRTKITNSPPGPGMSKNGAILRTALPSVPIFKASQLERVVDELRHEEMSDVPKKVRQLGSEAVFFFKAGFKDHGHLREIELLSQIRRSDKLDAPFRTSKLVGLVFWDHDQDSLMGFLLDFIDGETLGSRAENASVEMKTKWTGQVEATLKQLHEIGIVWGDVKPDNFIISKDGDAVVIDFGGGYTPEYIRPELQQTAQGDLIGLDHIRAVVGVPRDGV